MAEAVGVGSRPIPSALFAGAVFASAGLVFLVEPMIARMVLPLLGGSSSVWNTSLAFFQAALLAGYAYAHLLQRVRTLRTQMVVHLAVLALAAAFLPLRISEALGPPSSNQPAMWLLGVLLVSVGAPFAALSATAPLLQAWYARLGPEGLTRNPYVLYAASNLGSLIALIAYPLVAEPLLRLHVQAQLWTVGYVLFALLVIGLTLAARKEVDSGTQLLSAPPVAWRERLVWIGLSAATSSLLLGVTAHVTQDVASAPFLWVIRLALYLLSFVFAFQERSAIPQGWALYLQAGFAPFAAALYSLLQAPWIEQLAANLGAFFFTAMVCHQSLAARKPDPARLTDFYLSMSVGGLIGGAFNAFAAPVVFNAIWEYPIVMGLACLARPWGRGRLDHWSIGLIACAAICLATLLLPKVVSFNLVMMLLTVVGCCAFLLRRHGAIFAVLVLALGVVSYDQLFKGQRETHRSFFGMVQLIRAPAPVFGTVKLMVHGSTLHGAQAERPSQRRALRSLLLRSTGESCCGSPANSRARPSGIRASACARLTWLASSKTSRSNGGSPSGASSRKVFSVKAARVVVMLASRQCCSTCSDEARNSSRSAATRSAQAFSAAASRDAAAGRAASARASRAISSRSLVGIRCSRPA